MSRYLTWFGEITQKPHTFGLASPLDHPADHRDLIVFGTLDTSVSEITIMDPGALSSLRRSGTSPWSAIRPPTGATRNRLPRLSAW